jgi:hypothetical protein
MTSALGNVASLAARAGGSVVRQVRSVLDPARGAADGAGDEPASRWLVVTVFREPADLDATQLPAPLAELGERIEVRTAPAADGKGTELAARLRDPASQAAAKAGRRDARTELRSALRQAKQLIEVGEVLAVDPTPHGKRSATPGGVLLETVTRRAGKEGVL